MGRQVAAIALLLGLTAPGPAAAFELKQTEAGATVHWQEDAVALRLDASVRELLPEGDAELALDMATEAWRIPRAPTVLRNRSRPGPMGYDPSAPRQFHGVYAVSDWPYGEGDIAVTVSTFEERTGRLIDTDIVVNANHRFRLLAERGDGDRAPRGRGARGGHYDLGAVLAHEVGHTLGLDESPDDEEATMWARIGRGETHQRSIEVDDEEGVLAIYGRRSTESAGGCGPAAVAGRPSLGAALPWVLGLMLGLVCLILRGRGPSSRVRRRALPVVTLPATLVASALLLPVPPVHSAPDGASEGGPALATPSVASPIDRSRATNGHAVVGTAHRLGSRLRDGVLWTRIRVGTGAEAVELEVPGGTRGGITQRVGDTRLPPEGAALRVEEGPSGMLRWWLEGWAPRDAPTPFDGPADGSFPP